MNSPNIMRELIAAQADHRVDVILERHGVDDLDGVTQAMRRAATEQWRRLFMELPE